MAIFSLPHFAGAILAHYSWYRFFGTRVTLKNLFDYIETGETIEEFLNDFEEVKKEKVIWVLEFSQRQLKSSTDILNENIAQQKHCFAKPHLQCQCNL